ncbi:hypothetical protein A0H81_02268 [Grifola frondosa]|uniref:Uncharacterized protein n=1 Tax=Grifola frondosa TaxID=5627 RepID=A0A1C7MPH5_GRIFR|nr:hypothetical protein A0H81_02268 [Grifola frondosa]
MMLVIVINHRTTRTSIIRADDTADFCILLRAPSATSAKRKPFQGARCGMINPRPARRQPRARLCPVDAALHELRDHHDNLVHGPDELASRIAFPVRSVNAFATQNATASAELDVASPQALSLARQNRRHRAPSHG